MTLKNNRAPLLSNIKLCASFHHHRWIQTGVTVQKRLNGVMTSVTLTFDLWSWLFAWTLCLPLVITPENFMMIRRWEHSEKGVTEGRTDRKTERSVLRAAWSQLKNIKKETQKVKLTCHWRWQLYTMILKLVPWTETEWQTAMTNQPEEWLNL